jgi:DNA/RNA-binding domain of Phe-tRNA-synthetase-like protein
VTFELDLARGPVDPELAAEFPYLALFATTLATAPRRSPPPVRERLRALGDRYTGGKAVQLRQQPIPWAYRVFFRQIGLDPDEHRTPPEAIALERMRHGGFESHGLVADALTIATVETGVAVLAYDADRLDGPPGLRLADAGERLGGDGRELSHRQLVVADRSRSLAVLFADTLPDVLPGSGTRRVTLAAVRVKGIPDVSIEEALWIASEVSLTGPDPSSP